MTGRGSSTDDRTWAPPPMNGYQPMIVNVALTGAVPSKADNETVPQTPEELAKDALACAEAGASVIHLHVRDEDGANVHRRDLYERAIEPIRASMPELVICVTTSSRVDPDPANRMIGLELEPPLRPDMGSLTLGSFNFPKVVSNNPPDQIRALLERMLELGIRPELEVFELGMVNTLHALRERGLIPDPPVVNILLGSFGFADTATSATGAIVEHRFIYQHQLFGPAILAGLTTLTNVGLQAGPNTLQLSSGFIPAGGTFTQNITLGMAGPGLFEAETHLQAIVFDPLLTAAQSTTRLHIELNE